MKNFKLKEEEEFITSYQDISVTANDNNFILTLFITNERLVLLKDVSTELTFNQIIKVRGVLVPSNYEVVFDITLDKIRNIHYKNSTNIITFKDNQNTLSLKCDNISEILNHE